MVGPNVTLNIHGNWEYIVDMKTQESGKRLRTFIRKAGIEISQDETTCHCRQSRGSGNVEWHADL